MLLRILMYLVIIVYAFHSQEQQSDETRSTLHFTTDYILYN